MNEPAQTTELTLKFEVSDTREAMRWLEQVVLTEGAEHGIVAVVDGDGIGDMWSLDDDGEDEA